VSGLAAAIGSDARSGLDPAAPAGAPGSIGEHARVYGRNVFKAVPPKNFFMLCFENLQDPIILLLIAAALVRGVAAAGFFCVLCACLCVVRL
jgi:Ca2+-transporting ATPase